MCVSFDDCFQTDLILPCSVHLLNLLCEEWKMCYNEQNFIYVLQKECESFGSCVHP